MYSHLHVLKALLIPKVLQYGAVCIRGMNQGFCVRLLVPVGWPDVILKANLN